MSDTILSGSGRELARLAKRVRLSEPVRDRVVLIACSVAAPIVAGLAAGLFRESVVSALWFVPPIFLVALWGGMAPASLSILVSLAAFDYWVLPPHNSLILTHLSDLWMAVGFAPCAALASVLGVRLRAQLTTIRRHETRSAALRLLSYAVVSQDSPEAVHAAAADALARAYEAPAVVLVMAGGALRLAGASRGATVGAGDLAAANWALTHNAPTGLSCVVLGGEDSVYDFWPLTTPTLSVVLGVGRQANASVDGLRDGAVELVAGYLLAGIRPRPFYVVR